jgi:FkbH-like protein
MAKEDQQKEQRLIKCVVWDLDGTLWKGVLLENDTVRLRRGVVEIIKTLDGRGILQSIASKNDFEQAIAKLGEFCLRDYFLYPQVNWNSKVSSIKAIAEALNLGLDSIAFIDDQRYELEEVTFSLPQVLCI